MTVTTNSPFLLLALTTAALVAGCGTDKSTAVYSGEVFHATGMYSHQYPFSAIATCEAARRALLSQGYVVADIKADIVNGQKSFQPTGDTHVEIAFHVVCVSDDPKGKTSTAFINALQDRYAIKKTPSSASLGVGAVGAVSLPFGSSDDSLVKIASETIPPGPIYDQFFALTGDYLKKIGADYGPEPKHETSSIVETPKPPATVPKMPPGSDPAKSEDAAKPAQPEGSGKATSDSSGQPKNPGVSAPDNPAGPHSDPPLSAAPATASPADPPPAPSLAPPASGPSSGGTPPPVEPQNTETIDRSSSPKPDAPRRGSGLIES